MDRLAVALVLQVFILLDREGNINFQPVVGFSMLYSCRD